MGRRKGARSLAAQQAAAAAARSQLGPRVKIAGSTIGCEGVPLRGFGGSGVWRRTPHVQSFALALDRQASEVWKVLGAVQTEFERHGQWVARIQQQVAKPSDTLE